MRHLYEIKIIFLSLQLYMFPWVLYYPKFELHDEQDIHMKFKNYAQFIFANHLKLFCVFRILQEMRS